jgi:hypothetical protein
MSQRKRFDQVKGARCGVDNCPSTWYTIVGGHYICENGHIEHQRLVEEAEADLAQSQGYGIQHRLKSAQGSKRAVKVLRWVILNTSNKQVKLVEKVKGFICLLYKSS